MNNRAMDSERDRERRQNIVRVSALAILLIVVYVLMRGCMLEDEEFLVLVVCTAGVIAVLLACPSLSTVASNASTAEKFSEGNRSVLELPARVKDVVVPSLDRVSKGIQGTDEDPPVPVGDGLEQRFAAERAKEGDAYIGDTDFHPEDYEGDPDLQKEDGSGLDRDKYDRMLLEYKRLDYLLCRLKFGDRPTYERLLALDWLWRYNAASGTGSSDVGQPPPWKLQQSQQEQSESEQKKAEEKPKEKPKKEKEKEKSRSQMTREEKTQQDMASMPAWAKRIRGEPDKTEPTE